MKVYFTTSIKGTAEYGDASRAIIEELKKQGHSVFKRPLQTYPTPEGHAGVPDKNIGDLFDFKEQPMDEIYKTTVRRIREADMLITEMSVPSGGTGYEIALAHNEKKPVLALINSSITKPVADVIEGNASKLFKMAKYKSNDDIPGLLKTFMNDARQAIDTKFILIISPEIDKYLEWASNERRMHKAQLVRNAVEDVMNKDKEYKDFLKTLDN